MVREINRLTGITTSMQLVLFLFLIGSGEMFHTEIESNCVTQAILFSSS
jgi:hypothetical protein